MSTITDIQAREIRDSRNNPTIEVTVSIGDIKGVFAVPSGASTGIHEAHELRDADGGVTKALENIDRLVKPALLGMDASLQDEIDHTLLTIDGTQQKTTLGGNVTIGVSLAVARAQASVSGCELWEHLAQLYGTEKQTTPRLYINLSGGGKHVVKGPAFQEYHIIPQTNNLTEALDMSHQVWTSFTQLAQQSYGSDLVSGDEGGLTIPSIDTEVPLELLYKAIRLTGNENKVALSLDVAASSFYQNGSYEINGTVLNRDELLNYYGELVTRYPLISIEDPLHEEDFEGFAMMRLRFPDVDIVGDDLTVTNKDRLKEAITTQAIDALIIKPNQIGTLTETVQTIRLAQEHGIKTIVSHRSGETQDDSIADIVKGLACSGLKAGDPSVPIRRLKYERLQSII